MRKVNNQRGIHLYSDSIFLCMSEEHLASAPACGPVADIEPEKVIVASPVEEAASTSCTDEQKAAQVGAASIGPSAVVVAPRVKQYNHPLVGFPDVRPAAPPFDHGWFLQTHVNVFSALITENTKVIFEIGSWYGASTKWVRMCYCITLSAGIHQLMSVSCFLPAARGDRCQCHCIRHRSVG